MSTAITYKSWDDVPDNLATKTTLKRQGLKPAKDQPVVAYKRNYYRGSDYRLYDVSQAIPCRQPSPAQLAALEKARQAATEALTCKGCGWVFHTTERGHLRNGYCLHCRDHRRAVRWAKKILADPGVIILDTETTGLEYDDEVLEVSVINIAGDTLLDTLVKPTVPISAGALETHGIGHPDLTEAPTFDVVFPQIKNLILAATYIVIYNADFDRRILRQTCEAHQLPTFWLNVRKFHCAMNGYAEWYGEWSSYHESYRWQPLNGGHRALGDCLATLERVKEMAQEELE